MIRFARFESLTREKPDNARFCFENRWKSPWWYHHGRSIRDRNIQANSNLTTLIMHGREKNTALWRRNLHFPPIFPFLTLTEKYLGRDKNNRRSSIFTIAKQFPRCILFANLFQRTYLLPLYYRYSNDNKADISSKSNVQTSQQRVSEGSSDIPSDIPAWAEASRGIDSRYSVYANPGPSEVRVRDRWSNWTEWAAMAGERRTIDGEGERGQGGREGFYVRDV